MKKPRYNAPLSNIKILDFSTLLPGPMATLFFSEAGAQVIKIEHPEKGDHLRHYNPKWETDSLSFAMLNKGKKSLKLDLKQVSKRKLLNPLILEADIIVEQFRPGVMKKFNLDFKTISKKRPDIIYCSITGFGQTGPNARIAGHDLNYIGNTGLLALSMGKNSSPVIPPVLIADIAGGSYPAILNILLALRKRDQTGEGSYIDISISECLFPLMFWAIGQGAVGEHWPKNGDSLFTGGSPRYQLYRTQDNKFLAAAPLEQKFWEKFCDLIKLENSLRDDSLDPQKTILRITEIVAKKPAKHWKRLCREFDCCCSIVVNLKDAMKDPHFRRRGVFDREIKNSKEETLPALPLPIVKSLRSSDADPKAPELGEHNKDFLF